MRGRQQLSDTSALSDSGWPRAVPLSTQWAPAWADEQFLAWLRGGVLLGFVQASRFKPKGWKLSHIQTSFTLSLNCVCVVLGALWGWYASVLLRDKTKKGSMAVCSLFCLPLILLSLLFPHYKFGFILLISVLWVICKISRGLWGGGETGFWWVQLFLVVTAANFWSSVALKSMMMEQNLESGLTWKHLCIPVYGKPKVIRLVTKCRNLWCRGQRNKNPHKHKWSSFRTLAVSKGRNFFVLMKAQ